MTTAIEPTAAELADVLDKAATVIETNGWHRGYLYDEDRYEEGTALRDCPVCALGAINAAVCGSPLLGITGEHDIYSAIALADAAANAVARHLNVAASPREVAWWNDELHRKQDDVVQAFRDTAANLRAGEAS